MRDISMHVVDGDLAKQVGITVLDEPGNGGGHHRYSLWLPDLTEVVLQFQDGPIKEVGINGITQEALLAVVIDRLTCFQNGDFACEENEKALQYTSLALLELQKRTAKRLGLGIEGTSELEQFTAATGIELESNDHDWALLE